MSQAKLTSSGGELRVHPVALAGHSSRTPTPQPATDQQQQPMETGSTAVNAAAAPLPPLTTEFFLKSLKDNNADLMKSFSAHLNGLAEKVGSNSERIRENERAINSQGSDVTKNRLDIEKLTARVKILENTGAPKHGACLPTRALLSKEYLSARRSARVWPIIGTDDEAVWQSVGEFLHETLEIPDTDIGQEDIEDIRRVEENSNFTNIVRDEVIIVFKDKKKRDLMMASSVALAKCIDPEGRPTAGTRLEIPKELEYTFRLLSRFGTRLRARHGVGTKRHVKFDDFEGSLYMNVKLPGDHDWTRVSPDMAREDLTASMREENVANQK